MWHVSLLDSTKRNQFEVRAVLFYGSIVWRRLIVGIEGKRENDSNKNSLTKIHFQERHRLTLCAVTKNLFHHTDSCQQNVGLYISRRRLKKLERVIDRKSMTLTPSLVCSYRLFTVAAMCKDNESSLLICFFKPFFFPKSQWKLFWNHCRDLNNNRKHSKYNVCSVNKCYWL